MGIFSHVSRRLDEGFGILRDMVTRLERIADSLEVIGGVLIEMHECGLGDPDDQDEARETDPGLS